ncbi:Kinesin-like protein KIFC3 [Hordeum vulgare]|nr:Kinesin-like protein KIFC3 [Hordeum vulgare]
MAAVTVVTMVLACHSSRAVQPLWPPSNSSRPPLPLRVLSIEGVPGSRVAPPEGPRSPERVAAAHCQAPPQTEQSALATVGVCAPLMAQETSRRPSALLRHLRSHSNGQLTPLRQWPSLSSPLRERSALLVADLFKRRLDTFELSIPLLQPPVGPSLNEPRPRGPPASNHRWSSSACSPTIASAKHPLQSPPHPCIELRDSPRHDLWVGNTAFAVEGQVKEKTRWCQLLKDLSEKFKAFKIAHQILLKESQDYKKCLLDAMQLTTTVHQYGKKHDFFSHFNNQYASLESEFKDLKEKFSEEAKERKDLYNKLIELKGNIRVFYRCRPLNTEETAEGASMAIDFDSAKDGELIVGGHLSSKKVFKFDSFFNPEEYQGNSLVDAITHLGEVAASPLIFPMVCIGSRWPSHPQLLTM